MTMVTYQPLVLSGRPTVQNPLRRSTRGPRTRTLTAEQYDEVQKLVFDLVRERLVAAFGPNGLWTVGMKGDHEDDEVFSETVAESLAWDVAHELGVPTTIKTSSAPVTLATDERVEDQRAEQLVA